jgi:uncharacterized membrane protein YhaH (DUF805 family)
MSFPKTFIGWIGLSVIVIAGFVVTISDNPLVSMLGLPIMVLILVLFGLAAELLTGDSSKRKAAVEQIKRNLSDKRRLIRAVLAGISWVLWPVTNAFVLLTVGWKLRSFLLSFKGRVSRKMYWQVLFIYFSWAFTTAVVQGVILGLTQGDTNEGVPPFAFYLTLVVAVGPIIASAPAIGVRRLHDINKSGWWLFLFYLIPALCLGLLNFTAIPRSTRGLLLIFPFLPVTIWAFIELGCRRGTPGPNKYGLDPVEIISAAPP